MAVGLLSGARRRAWRSWRMYFGPAYFVRREWIRKFLVEVLVGLHVRTGHAGPLVLLRHVYERLVLLSERFPPPPCGKEGAQSITSFQAI